MELVVIVLMPRVVVHSWHTGHVVAPRARLFPTTLPDPQPVGPRVSSVVFHGEPAHPVYLRGLFLPAHLHDPYLCRRGHALSNEDSIVWLWLLGSHGWVVTHICKDIGVVVPLYVLIVVISGCLLEDAVPGGPPYGESFR